jgi:hypothetical protein
VLHLKKRKSRGEGEGGDKDLEGREDKRVWKLRNEKRPPP